MTWSALVCLSEKLMFRLPHAHPVRVNDVPRGSQEGTSRGHFPCLDKLGIRLEAGLNITSISILNGDEADRVIHQAKLVSIWLPISS